MVCAGNELFYVALYLVQWDHSSVDLGTFGTHSWAQLLCYLCGPVCVYKNVVNVVQLWKASKILVGLDLVERAKARDEAARVAAANEKSGEKGIDGNGKVHKG